MTFQTDLITALASVVGGRVYPNIAPENATYPLVNYRVLNKEPIATVDGVVHATKFTVVFECWATNYTTALTTAASVRAAINASVLTWYPVDEPGEDYEPTTDSYMESVYYGFLHV